jgi:hypothetical protein
VVDLAPPANARSPVRRRLSRRDWQAPAAPRRAAGRDFVPDDALAVPAPVRLSPAAGSTTLTTEAVIKRPWTWCGTADRASREDVAHRPHRRVARRRHPGRLLTASSTGGCALWLIARSAWCAAGNDALLGLPRRRMIVSRRRPGCSSASAAPPPCASSAAAGAGQSPSGPWSRPSRCSQPSGPARDPHRHAPAGPSPTRSAAPLRRRARITAIHARWTGRSAWSSAAIAPQPTVKAFYPNIGGPRNALRMSATSSSPPQGKALPATAPSSSRCASTCPASTTAPSTGSSRPATASC